MSNQNSSVQFKRKTYAKGFNNHKGLDEFIQGSLDKYQFVDPKDEMYDATGDYSKYIVSNKSAIPDLVIWNKKFNKNECYYGADTKEYNSFPRFKFILRAKPPIVQGKTNLTKGREKAAVASHSNRNGEKKDASGVPNGDDDIPNQEEAEEDNKKLSAPVEARYDPYNEDEEPQWMDVDVTEFENVKLEFKSLPGMEKNINVDTKNEILNDKSNYKLAGIIEESSLHDESHDLGHLERIIKLNISNEDEKINDFIILKDDKEITNLNTENLFNMNYDIFVDKKTKETIPILLNNFGNEKEKEIALNTLEKNSLFENDFAFIFKSNDENKQPTNVNTCEIINTIPEQISQNSNIVNINSEKSNLQIEQSTNILFENNIFEPEKIKKDIDFDLEEVKKLQKNLLPNQIHQFEEFSEEEEDDNYINYNSLLPNQYLIRDKILLNTNIPQHVNMKMRMGMPFNLPQNPNMIPMPIHPMNMINNFGNFDDFGQNENKNQFMKSNPINMNQMSQINQMNPMNQISPMSQMNPMNQMNQNQQNSVINHIFLENPTSIVQKNMYKKGWLLMTLNDKILGQFNSVDLFKYLEKKISEGWNFEHTWITDYDTDMYFTPANLYEILKEIVPIVIGNVMNKNKNPQLNFGGMNINPNMNPNLNPNMNPNFNPNINFNPMPFSMPHPMNPMNMRPINLNNPNNQEDKLNQGNKPNSNKNVRMNTPSPNLQNVMPNMMRIHNREDNMNVNHLPYSLDPRFQNMPINIQNNLMKNMQPSTSNPKNIQNYGNNIQQGIQAPMNMNINLQFVKNNINLNNISLSNNMNNMNQPVSNSSNVTSKIGTSINNNKSMSDKNLSGPCAKDMFKFNNNVNNEASIFNSNMFPEKNLNANSNNRSIQNKKKK